MSHVASLPWGRSAPPQEPGTLPRSATPAVGRSVMRRLRSIRRLLVLMSLACYAYFLPRGAIWNVALRIITPQLSAS